MILCKKPYNHEKQKNYFIGNVAATCKFVSSAEHTKFTYCESYQWYNLLVSFTECFESISDFSTNQNSGIEGEITSSTIVLINGVYYASGRGQHMSGDYARNIRLSFKSDVDGNLTFDFVNGGTETCTGNPCEECEFASGGGCNCKRTKESSSGTNGSSNHSVTKESPCTSGI